MISRTAALHVFQDVYIIEYVRDIYRTLHKDFMDGKKDIQRADYLSRFLDTPVVQTNPFGRNVSGSRAYRRAERLVAAIHILTNHVSPQEPSRIEVRSTGVKLLTDLLTLRDEMRASASPVFRAVQASIRKLVSLVRILSVSGHASFQNASSVIEALDELGNFLTSSQRSTLSESATFTKDDLIGGDSFGVQVASVKGPSLPRVRDESKSIKDSISVKNIYKTGRADSAIEQVLDKRGVAILNTLKDQGVIGIKDISSNLPEYSEKMVQRELAHLILIGRVKKTGFKRWSKYTFVR